MRWLKPKKGRFCAFCHVSPLAAWRTLSAPRAHCHRQWATVVQPSRRADLDVWPIRYGNPRPDIRRANRARRHEGWTRACSPPKKTPLPAAAAVACTLSSPTRRRFLVLLVDGWRRRRHALSLQRSTARSGASRRSPSPPRRGCSRSAGRPAFSALSCAAPPARACSPRSRPTGQR